MTSRWCMQLTDPNAIQCARIAANAVGRVGNGAPYVTGDGRLAIPYDPTEGLRAFLYEVQRLTPIDVGAAALQLEVFPQLRLRPGGPVALRGDNAKDRLGYIDWQALHRRFWALKAWKDAPSWRRQLPHLTVRWSRVPEVSATGHAWWHSQRMIVTINPACDEADVLDTILHEQAHLVGYHKHNGAFRTALNAAIIEAFGVEGVDPRGDWKTQWDFGVAQETQIRAVLHRLDLPRVSAMPPPCTPTEADVTARRAERTAVMVARRYERARATLAVHEAKLRREQLLVKKWKRKVNGYERRAAAKRAPRDGEGS